MIIKSSKSSIIIRLPRYLLKSFKDFYIDEGIFLSAALAFFSILSIMPLSMFVVNILLNIIQEEKIIKFVYGKLVNIFPEIEFQTLKILKRSLASKEVSTGSLILYGIFSLQLFTAIEFSLNKIFNISNKRNFIKSFLMSFFMIAIIITLSAASFTVSYIIKAFQPLLAPELHIVTSFFLKNVLSFLLILTLAMLVYKIIPNKKIKFKLALTGAIITTTLIEIAKYIFTFYVSEVINMSTLYGTVFTLPILLMWLFYVWSVFLYGAEVIKNLERK